MRECDQRGRVPIIESLLIAGVIVFGLGLATSLNGAVEKRIVPQRVEEKLSDPLDPDRELGRERLTAQLSGDASTKKIVGGIAGIVLGGAVFSGGLGVLAKHERD